MSSSSNPLTVSCHCGCVRGEIRAPHPTRLVCYCDDCQKFAAWVLDRNPSTAQALQPVDDLGGTDTLLVYKPELTITTGSDRVKLVKLTHKSHTLRAYANCCASPLFHTTRSSPLVGVVASAIQDPKANIGQVKYRIHGKFAKRPPPENLHVAAGVPFALRAQLMMKGLMKFAGKGKPAPVNLDAGSLVIDQQA